MQNQLNRQSSSESKRLASDALFDSISELLFERVNLISGTFVTAGSTTSTSNYDFDLRVIDTSIRKFMSPDRKIRFRCTFYLTNHDKSICYILVPATLDSINAPTNVTSLANYVGIKILRGDIYLVSKDSGPEKVINTNTSLEFSSIATFSETYYLEIQYNVNSMDVFLDNQLLGSISCNMIENIYSYETFYPLVAPIISTDGTSVNINMESYQILQDK